MVVSNPPDFQNTTSMGLSLLYIVFAPMQTYILHFRQAYLEMKIQGFPNEKSLQEEKEKLKRTLNMQVKLELGLETIYQLVGNTLLLLLTLTGTPTQSGLKTMFSIDLHPEARFQTIILLTVSICLSFHSCMKSHLKGLTGCREWFPLKSKITAYLYGFFGCIPRVMVLILFFSGPLGLFDLLGHLKGEQYPWHPYVLNLVNSNGILDLGNTSIEWAFIDRWIKDSSVPSAFINERGFFTEINPDFYHTAPDYTLYTGLFLSQFLFLFIGIVFIHVLTIFVVKSLISEDFRNHFNLLEKIIHCMENTNIVHNAKEWDDGKGDALAHGRRMQSNWKENVVTIIIKAFFNIVLLLPLCYLGDFKIGIQNQFLRPLVRLS